MLDLKKNDLISGTSSHNKGIRRMILKKRKTGYDWKYPDIDEVFRSENSSDPYFEMGWQKVDDNGLLRKV